jgi:hypothetical protein
MNARLQFICWLIAALTSSFQNPNSGSLASVLHILCIVVASSLSLAAVNCQNTGTYISFVWTLEEEQMKPNSNEWSKPN